MQPTLLAIRSIGAELANRIYLAAGITALIITAIFFAVLIWLTTLSAWWWLLFAFWVLVALVVLILFIFAKAVIKTVAPEQSKDQKRQTKTFVDKLQSLSEMAGTPKLILLFQVVRDMLSPRENGFIAQLANDTTSLKQDFIALVKAFTPQQ